ncbi:MAG: thioredoxin domain-containing protein, partial [Candidatus Omnitrophica bacterium]|nr:thioredoxin domain-containing protein [Candidatus Omnitrophota bacterium]
MGGEKLTKADLRKTVSNELIPIENDEYLVLSRGVEEWLNTRLLQQEAKAQGLTSEELYKKEIWSKVQVSYSDLQEYYNKTKELYNEPFEKVSPLIMQELRRSEYARVKKEYLDGLKKKYSAKIHLQKPKTFVEGLALPSPLPSSPSAGVAAAVQGIVPQGAGGPVNPKSEIGKFPSKGPENAPITIAEFSDFHCPFCKKVEPTIDQLMKNYPDKVRVVWRHYPLPFHTGADRTHEASM